MHQADAPPHVVIVGGGFAGLRAARGLADAPLRVTLVDRGNYHVFQPLLYQVATAGLSAPDIGAPIRKILARQANVTVLMAEVTGVDVETRCVQLTDGVLDYDVLILATGVATAYFGHDDWAPHAPGLKTLGDALEIRGRILAAYEQAERITDAAHREPWLTFVVIGGGPTGVELAGALAEIARRTLARNFRRFDPADARVVLIEGSDRVLPGLSEPSSARAARELARLAVEVRTSTRVTGVDEHGVDMGPTRLAARTVLWAAGVQASALTAALGAITDGAGRVPVEPDLSLPGHGEVFVVGDAAALSFSDRQGHTHPVPGMAPAAIQQGRHVARNVLRRLAGEPTEPFVYRDAGALATIGRSAAVAELGRFRFGGLVAWLLWVVVHITFLIGFRNRFVVLFEWAWAYVTLQRSARVILEEAEAPTSSDVRPPSRPRSEP